MALAISPLRSAEEVEIWDNDANNWNGATLSDGDPIDAGAQAVSGLRTRIAVDHKGRAYVAYIQSDGTLNRLYLTRYDGSDMKIWDHGGTAWTDTFSNGDPVDPGNGSAISELDIVVDSQDRVYLLEPLDNGYLYLVRYDGTGVKIWDEGTTSWTTTLSNGDPVMDGTASWTNCQYPTLAVDAQDRVYYAFGRDEGSDFEYDLYLGRYDGTRVRMWDNDTSSWITTFSNADPIDTGTGKTTQVYRMAVDASNRVYVSYMQHDGTRNHIYLSRYDGTDVKIWDNGAPGWTETFSNGDPIDTTAARSASFPSMAIDGSDRVYVSFSQHNGTRNRLYLSRYDGTVKIWETGGSSWTTTLSEGDPIDTTATHTATTQHIAIDSAGRAYIGFVQSDGTYRRLRLHRYDGTSMAAWDTGGAGWTTTLASGDPIDSSSVGVSTYYTQPVVRIDSQDRVYIAYSGNTGTKQHIYLTRYDGAGVAGWDNDGNGWGDIADGDPIDTTAADSASFSDMAIDAADRAYVAYPFRDGTRYRLHMSRYRPAEAATYDARVSVFYQGISASNVRAMGSLIGVWNFTGATFATDRRLDWVREAPYSSADDALGSVQILKSDPRYAWAMGEAREVWTWAGSSWTRATLPGSSGLSEPLYDIDALSSSFVVASGDNSRVVRWTGTTWLNEQLRTAATHHIFYRVDMLSTDFGLVAGDSGPWLWRGTSWIAGPYRAGVTGGGAVVATDFVWARQGSAMLKWTGTSWTTFTALHGGGYPFHVEAIHGERDFALAIGYQATATPSIYRWTGTSWVTDMLGRSLNRVEIVNTSWAWAVGDNGYVARWTGTSWVEHGPLTGGTTQHIFDVDAFDTGFALACGFTGGGKGVGIWIWRGTSWLHWRTEGGPDTASQFGSGGYGTGVSTVGEHLSFAAGNHRQLWKRQTPGITNLTSRHYRAVVQVTPKGSMWTWAGTSDTQSYFGLPDHASAIATEFRDSSEGQGNVTLNRTGGGGSSAVEDIFIWVDTVGGWDGASSPHNNDSATGLGLVESGGVDNSPSGADYWGESDRRISCSDGGTTDWTTKAGNTGAGPQTVVRDDTLTWEYWHHYAGAASGTPVETGLHVGAGPFGTELSSLRWRVAPWNVRLRTGAWRWCRDDAAQPQAMKPVGSPLDDAATTGERMRLRVRLDERDGGWLSSAALTLWWSTDQATWTQLTTTSSTWKLFDGQGTAGGTVASTILPGAGVKGTIVESTSSNFQGFDPHNKVEADFSVESSSADADTVYYFEAACGGRRCLPVPGVKYPQVRTTADATFNYLYSEASKGPFGRPVRNLQVISGGNGEAFKVAYVTTQSGSADKVYAVSRTNGAIARSYTASGTLDYPLIYWDSTGSRYNLFFVQSGYRILALTDDGTTITANTAWASDGLKSFGNSTADPISEPIRIFDSDKQNYLYFIVTSYQNNTSTLYKVRASDGAVATGGNYSASAQSIGVNAGLMRTIPPLYVDGTVYGIDRTDASASPPGPYAWKIPSSGGGHASWSPNFEDVHVSVLPIWYTRNSLSSGPRVLVMTDSQSAVSRISTADMAGADWTIFGDWPGEAYGSANPPTCGAVSGPFGSTPPPVFAGGAGGGALNVISRFSGSQGGEDANFPYSITGSVSSGLALNGSWLYFGTDRGYIYAISATDPTQSAGTRFRVPGDSPVVGVHVDAARSVVYFTTADGRVYQFDTR